MEFPIGLFSNSSLDLERVSYNLKSETELALWSTCEDISEKEKAEYFLDSGFPLQKSWVMQHLHLILTSEPHAILKTILVIPTKQNIVNWAEDLQLEFGQGLLHALDLNLIPDDLKLEAIQLSLTFLSFYSRTLHSKWLPVYKCLLPQIPAAVIKSKIVPELILLSDLSQKVIIRQVSCHLLAELAKVMNKDFKGLLLQRVKSLSQDTNPEVRQEMAEVWIEVIKAVGRNVLEETIFSDIFKLIEDEVEGVKFAGVRLLIQTLEIVSEGYLQKDLAGVMKRGVFNSEDPDIQALVCENLGMIVVGCRGGYRIEIFKAIKTFMEKDACFRSMLAFNFPAIASVLTPCAELKEIAGKLSNDPEESVRITLAAGFHEVISLSPHCRILKKIAAQFLEDPATQPVLLKNLKNWTKALDPSQILAKSLRILTQTKDWRSQLTFLSSLEHSLQNFNQKDLLDCLVPLLLHKMLTGCNPIKLCASSILACLIAQTFYLSRKLDICNIVKEKFLRSKSSYDRIVFIEFCLRIVTICSRRFFLKHFWEELVGMVSDPVASVRLRLVKALKIFVVYMGVGRVNFVLESFEVNGRTEEEIKEEVIEYLAGKELLELSLKAEKEDSEKEKKEMEIEVQEIKEIENSKRRVSDEVFIKVSAEGANKAKKVGSKGRLEVKEIKPRGTKSATAIKPLLPVKKKQEI